MCIDVKLKGKECIGKYLFNFVISIVLNLVSIFYSLFSTFDPINVDIFPGIHFYIHVRIRIYIRTSK